MSVTLPALPRLADVSPRLIDYGGNLVPPLGGPEQRILRLGSRFAVEVKLPPMDEACARQWIAARLRSLSTGETLVLTLPASDGAPAGVSGAGSANSVSMTVSGGAPAVGQMFSFASGGRNYLHTIAAISGSSATVAPRLRAAVSGSLDFAAPKLEGWLDGQQQDWDISFLRWVGQSFTLRENR